MQLKEIYIKDIKSNPAQPEIRITPTALKGLKSSISTKGLLCPITVRENLTSEEHKYTNLDGHRRVQCYLELGHEKIWANVLNGELGNMNDMQAFRELGEFNRRISALEYLDVYLAGGEVPATLQKHLAFIIEKLGRKAIRQLRNEKISPYSVLRLHPFFKRLELGAIDFKQYWNWVVKHRMVRTMIVMEKLNYSEKRIERLKNCITNDTIFLLED